MSAEAIAVSLFNDVFATSVRLESMDPEQIAELIRNTTKPLKPQLPLLKLARFGNTAVPHTGSLRHDQNLVACTGVEGDYDGEQVSFDEACERLLKSNISCIVCTTPSYTIDRPRWRVFAWYSCELPPGDRPRMMDRLNGALGGILAAESWTLSQSYFYGSVNENPNHRVEIIDGECVDRLDELDLIAIGKPTGASGARPNGHDRTGGLLDEEALKQAIRTREAYHESCTRLLGKWIREGVAFDEAERRLFVLFDEVPKEQRDARWAERRGDIPRTVDGIFGKDARRKDAADGEFAAIQQAISKLTHGCDSNEVMKIIGQIALAALPPLVEDRLISDIHRLTGEKRTILSETLKRGKKKLKVEARAPGPSWLDKLIRNDEGAPQACVANAIIALRLAPEWQGVLAFDLFERKMVIRRNPPWTQDPVGRDWTDVDDIRTTNWLQTLIPGIFVTPFITCQAVVTVARDHEFHPVRDYFNGLVWDGKKRLDNWLTYHLGVEPDPTERPRGDESAQQHWDNQVAYIRAVSSRWMIAAVARIFRPGCKVDFALILEGDQGKKKSTALRVLGDPWFTDDLAELGSKDCAIQLAGRLILEIGELSSMTRADIDKVKTFMTRTTDRYRPVWGKHTIDQPRECSFAGTSNRRDYLTDETGGRRWLPVWCSNIDIDTLYTDRDQLWAEAVARFRNGEKWHFDTGEFDGAAEEQQEARRLPDAWEEPIQFWIDGKTPDGKLPAGVPKTEITITEVLRDALFVLTDKMDQRSANRVARCLRALKWERFNARIGGKREWRYRKRDASGTKSDESGTK